MWFRNALPGVQRKERNRRRWNHRHSSIGKFQAQVTIHGIHNARQSSARTDALRRDRGFQIYVSQLGQAGYFKGEMEDSQAWKVLEERAGRAYTDMLRNEYV
jgi:hypothetical protein